MNTARTLASYKDSRRGYLSCMCPACHGKRGRTFAKREWNKAIRQSEEAQINDEIKAENDFDGDVTWSIYQRGLTLDSARNLRSVDWNY